VGLSVQESVSVKLFVAASIVTFRASALSIELRGRHGPRDRRDSNSPTVAAAFEGAAIPSDAAMDE
jgi:hypothetical protein